MRIQTRISTIGLACMAGTLMCFSWFSSIAAAETRKLPVGPPSGVEKSVDEHLVTLFVIPPEASENYEPGRISVFLRREHPEYLYVPLETTREAATPDRKARLRVQLAIIPNKQTEYSIYVLDRTGKQTKLLFSKPLSEISISKTGE